MEKLAETGIGDLFAEKLSRNGMLGAPNLADKLADVLFRGTAAYLCTLKTNNAVLNFGVPSYSGRKTFLGVTFRRFEDKKCQIKFRVGNTISSIVNEEDYELLDFYEDKEKVLKFISAFAYLEHGIVFNATKDDSNVATNVSILFASLIYSIEDYMLSNYDDEDPESNKLKIPGLVSVTVSKMHNKEFNFDDVVFGFETLLDLDNINETIIKVENEMKNNKK